MKRLTKLTTIHLFMILYIPIAAVFGSTLLTLLLSPLENRIYLLRTVPLMLENGLAALTVSVGGAFVFELTKKIQRIQ